MNPPRIGIDIVAIARISRLVERHGEAFLRRFLSENEIALVRKSGTKNGGEARNLRESCSDAKSKNGEFFESVGGGEGGEFYGGVAVKSLGGESCESHAESTRKTDSTKFTSFESKSHAPRESRVLCESTESGAFFESCKAPESCAGGWGGEGAESGESFGGKSGESGESKRGEGGESSESVSGWGGEDGGVGGESCAESSPESSCESHAKSPQKSWRIETIAGFYAAKEALSKALGCGIGGDFGFFDAEISKDSRNAPKIALSAAAAARFGATNIALSISHDGGFAIAVVAL